MAKKKKSKLKRFLKKAAPLLAAGLGAAALSKRGRNLGVSGADKGLFTSDAAYMDNTMPGNLSRNMGMKRRRRDSILANPNINRMDLSEVDLDYTAPNTEQYRNMDMGLGPFAAKDGGRARHRSGGRVGCGVAKKGFGRAMKKGRKK
jgi:hypothetical protein